MNRRSNRNQSDAPFGTEVRRSRFPILLWGLLYVLWFGVLVWMAVQHPAR